MSLTPEDIIALTLGQALAFGDRVQCGATRKRLFLAIDALEPEQRALAWKAAVCHDDRLFCTDEYLRVAKGLVKLLLDKEFAYGLELKLKEWQKPDPEPVKVGDIVRFSDGGPCTGKVLALDDHGHGKTVAWVKSDVGALYSLFTDVLERVS